MSVRRLLSLVLVLAAPAAAQETSAPTSEPLTLVQAIALGRTRGVSAALARINVGVADARRAQRLGDLLPSISGNAAVSRQTVNPDELGIPFPAGFPTGVTDPFDLYRLQLRGSQTLFDASLFARLSAAGDSAAASGLDARAAGDLAGAAAGLAYLRVLSATETVRARVEDSVIADDLLEQARQLVTAGVSPSIDLTRSQVSAQAVRSQLVIARNQLDRARLDLSRTLDVPAVQEVILADSLGVTGLEIPTTPDEAVAYALAHRPDLAAEQRRLKAIGTSLKAIGYENLPSLSLSGYYQESGQHTDSLKGSYQAQLTLSIPLLDGFKRQNRHREQSARVDAQALRVHDLQRQVEVEARQSALDLSSAREQAILAAERVRLAAQELSQAQERFKAGVAGSVETTNAQSSVIAARDALIQSRFTYGTARVSAYRALGVLDQLR